MMETFYTDFQIGELARHLNENWLPVIQRLEERITALEGRLEADDDLAREIRERGPG